MFQNKSHPYHIVLIRSTQINPDSRLEKEAATLGKNGYLVSVLGWNRDRIAPSFEKKKCYNIHRIGPRAPIGLMVIFFWPIWWISEFLWLMKHDIHTVHVADFPSYVPAILFSKIRKARLIYDIFDFFPDLMVLPRLIHILFTKIEYCLMRFADRIIIVDKCRYSQIGKTPNSKEVVVIYNSPNDIHKNFGVKDSIKQLNTPINTNKFNIFYGGAMFHDRDVLSMLHLAMNNPELSLKIAGWGDLQIINEIENATKLHHNIEFIGMIKYEDLLSHSSEADMLFALYNPIVPNNVLASPNKLFEAMMCGKPIIVNEGVATADKVREENCGLVVPYGDYEALKEAVLTLKNNPELRKELGENGRRAYETKYNWKIMEKRLLDLYASLEKEQ